MNDFAYQEQDAERRRQMLAALLGGQMQLGGGTLSVDTASMYGLGKLATPGPKGLFADEMQF